MGLPFHQRDSLSISDVTHPPHDRPCDQQAKAHKVNKTMQNGRPQGTPVEKADMGQRSYSCRPRTVTSPSSPKPLNRLLVTVE